jgi:DNA-binding GntR family transcriptional regulator
MTPEREALILGALKERISQRGIARALKVGRQTVRAVRKKGRPA